ncbi:hypothetical protein F7R91_28800 [Streptomyces luteolifulvus]|uniref:Uncharacterized protein n=1 Tax=Streptomyces luteolifulvus TaxID=2615112 RepID=A0A6H9UUK5_9ACTN|nr:hypothetical protein [Streptomyces luteolifulvus]KAB1142511.1 hypothetical protein F7R91_28800 [Streptomyces luteolifulvus]
MARPNDLTMVYRARRPEDLALRHEPDAIAVARGARARGRQHAQRFLTRNGRSSLIQNGRRLIWAGMGARAVDGVNDRPQRGEGAALRWRPP